MSLDALDDAVVSAIATVAESAANTLTATLGEPAVVSVKKWPAATAAHFGANEIPGLAISRVTDQEEAISEFDQIERSTIRILYVAPATPGDSVDLRWPILRAVYNKIVRALREGVYPQHGNSPGDMKEAGVTGYVEGSGRVVYSLLQGEEAIHPSFIATLTFETTGEMLFRRDDLDRLEEVRNTISEPDALAATAPVEVTVEYDWS